MQQQKNQILGIDIQNTTKNDLLEKILLFVQSQLKQVVLFVNANNLTIANSDKEYNNILKKSKNVYGDGVGVSIAAKIAGYSFVDNVNGTDLFPMLCEMCQKEGISLFLLGGKQKVLQKLVMVLKRDYPKLVINGNHHGYFDHLGNNQSIIEQINSRPPDILLIGLGTPLQEKWINANYGKINFKVAICVGGLFDFYSGDIKRASKIFRLLGLEWLFRMLQEPQRLWKRYLIGIPQFIYIVLKQKYKK